MSVTLSIIITLFFFLLASSSSSLTFAQSCSSYDNNEQACNSRACRYVIEFPNRRCDPFPCAQRNMYNCYDPDFAQQFLSTRELPTGLDRTCFWVPNAASANGGTCMDCSDFIPSCPDGCVADTSGGGGGPGGGGIGPGGGGGNFDACVRDCEYSAATEGDCGKKVDTCQLDKRDSSNWKCAKLDMCGGIASESACDSTFCVWDFQRQNCRINECRSKLNKDLCNAVVKLGGGSACQWDEGLMESGSMSQCDPIPDCEKHNSNRSMCDADPCCGYDPNAQPSSDSSDDPSTTSIQYCKIMCNCLKTSQLCSARSHCSWNADGRCAPVGISDCTSATTKLTCHHIFTSLYPSRVCHWYNPQDISPAKRTASNSQFGYCDIPPCTWRSPEQCRPAAGSASTMGVDPVVSLGCFLYNTTNSGMKCGGCGTTNQNQQQSSPIAAATAADKSSYGYDCDFDPACFLDRTSSSSSSSSTAQTCKRRCDTFSTMESQQCNSMEYCAADATNYVEERSFSRRNPVGWPFGGVEHTISNCFQKLDPCSSYLTASSSTTTTTSSSQKNTSCVVGSSNRCQFHEHVNYFTPSSLCVRKCSSFNANLQIGTPANARNCKAASAECFWSESSNSCSNACWRAIFAAPAQRASVCESSDVGGGPECQWSNTPVLQNISSYLQNIRVNCFPLPKCNSYGDNMTLCNLHSSEECEWKEMSESSLTTGMCIIRCSFIKSSSVCTMRQGGWCKWELSRQTGSYVCVDTVPTTTSTTTTSTSTSTTSTTSTTTRTDTSTTSTTSTTTSTTSTTEEPTTSTTLAPGETNPPVTTPPTTVEAELDTTKPYSAVDLQSNLAAELGVNPENIAISQVNSSFVAITFVDVGDQEATAKLVHAFASFNQTQLSNLNLKMVRAAPGEVVPMSTTSTPAPPPEVGSPSNIGLLGAIAGVSVVLLLGAFFGYRYWKKKKAGGGAREYSDDAFGEGDSTKKAFNIDFDDENGTDMVSYHQFNTDSNSGKASRKPAGNNNRQQRVPAANARRNDPFAAAQQETAQQQYRQPTRNGVRRNNPFGDESI